MRLRRMKKITDKGSGGKHLNKRGGPFIANNEHGAVLLTYADKKSKRHTHTLLQLQQVIAERLSSRKQHSTKARCHS